MTRVPLGPFPGSPDFQKAADLDRNDPLGALRERFVIDDPETIYLDGNSLGRLPKRSIEIVDRVVRSEWGRGLIGSWNESWWDLQLKLGDRLASLIGARPGEVILSDGTSVNLYKLALAAIRGRPGRTQVVTDDLNFPTDVYVLRGVAEAEGGRLVVIGSDGVSGPVAGLESELGEETALLSLSHIVFKSGYAYDLAAVTEIAHGAGALVLWDLSHSVGVMPIDLTEAGVDLAVGCTYKYLGGGPGSPAFLYVRTGLQEQLANPITGWWGHAEPFAFDLEFRPVEGIRKFHTGTMPIASLAAIEGGIEVIEEAGIDRIRAKSVSLSTYLIEQCERYLAPLGFTLASPRDPLERGSHVSLTHSDAWAITRAMIELGKVIPDFRAPVNLRLGLAPLYTSHIEVHTVVQRISRIVESGAHDAFRDSRLTVT